VKTCREPRYYNSSRCHTSGSRRGGTGKLTSMNGCKTKRLSQKSRSSITQSQGPLSEPRRAVQPYRQQPLNLPLLRHSTPRRRTARLGGERKFQSNFSLTTLSDSAHCHRTGSQADRSCWVSRTLRRGVAQSRKARTLRGRSLCSG